MAQVSKLASATGQNAAQVKKLESAGKSLMGAYNAELIERNKKAQELKQQKTNRTDNNITKKEMTNKKDR